MSVKKAVESTTKKVEDMVTHTREIKEDALKRFKDNRPRPLANILRRRVRKRD